MHSSGKCLISLRLRQIFMIAMMVLCGCDLAYSQQSVGSYTLSSNQDEPIWIKGDDICQMLNRMESGVSPATSGDVKRARDSYKNGLNLFKQYLKSKDINLLVEAQPYFDTAFVADCKDTTYQIAVNRIYRLLEKHYREQGEYSKAIILGERLVRLNKKNFIEYSLYFALGNNYYKFKKTSFALINLKKAENLLKNNIEALQSASDSSQAAKLKNQMFYVLLLQYQIQNELNQQQESLAAVDKASRFAQTDEQKRVINNLTAYFNRLDFWGSKDALNLELEINKYKTEKQYEQAQASYERLLNQFPVFMDKRRVEVLLQYSLFEFQLLNLKAQAVNRLLPYIQVPLDSVKGIANIQSLFNAVSSMSYVYGKSLLDKDRFASFCLFKQAHVVPSEHKEKIAIEILKLSLNNLQESFNLGLDLWDKRENLSDAEKQLVCECLIISYKRNGDADATRRFYEEFLKL